MTVPTPPVVFDYPTWVGMFPEFAPLSAPQGQGYFNRACLICGNQCSNPIFATGNLPTLLYLLTSHIAWLSCPKDANGNPAATGTVASPLVGRIASAQQGSVNVQVEWAGGTDMSALEAYLTQTRYGTEYWAAIQQFRTARYIALPTIVAYSFSNRPLRPYWPLN